MKIETILTCLFLLLISTACQKEKRTKVEVVDYSTHVEWVWVNGYRDHWRACCDGRVSNVSEVIAYSVTAHVSLRAGGRTWQLSTLIGKVNLQPGEIGSFSCGGDSVRLDEGEYPPPDSAAHASVSVSWRR